MTIDSDDAFLLIALLGWIAYSLARIADRLKTPLVVNSYHFGYGTAVTVNGKVERASVLVPGDRE